MIDQTDQRLNCAQSRTNNNGLRRLIFETAYWFRGNISMKASNKQFFVLALGVIGANEQNSSEN
jgi:hypothetical protein